MAQMCKNCLFSREIGSESGVSCHRFPPTITKAEGPTVTSYFPLLSNDTWCGEWKQGKVGKRTNYIAP